MRTNHPQAERDWRPKAAMLAKVAPFRLYENDQLVGLGAEFHYRQGGESETRVVVFQLNGGAVSVWKNVHHLQSWLDDDVLLERTYEDGQTVTWRKGVEA